MYESLLWTFETPPSRLSLLEASQRTITELKAQLAETEKRLRILDARVAGDPARQEGLKSPQHGERFSVVDPASTSVVRQRPTAAKVNGKCRRRGTTAVQCPIRSIPRGKGRFQNPTWDSFPAVGARKIAPRGEFPIDAERVARV
jgi:hypothetical protein